MKPRPGALLPPRAFLLLLIAPAFSAAAADDTALERTTTLPATTQATTAPSRTMPSTVPATAPAPAPVSGRSFSLTELPERAASTAATLKRIGAELTGDRVIPAIEQRLGVLSGEIAARVQEGETLLAPAPSLDTLRTLEQDWSEIRGQLSDWSAELAAQAAALRRDEERLARLQDAWRRTLDEVRGTTPADAEVVARVESIVRQVSDARSRVAGRAAQVRSLQGRVAAQDVRAADTLAAVRDAQATAVNRLLERDSEPLWTGRLGPDGQQNLAEESRNSLSRQWDAMWLYARRYPQRFIGHALLVAALAFGASRLRRRWGGRLEAQPDSARSAAVFRMPIASAIVVTLPLVPWLYPHAPRLLMALLGGAMLVPAILVLRRVVIRPLLPLLYALAAFYTLGLIVSVTGSIPALSRSLFLLTMLGGVGLIAPFLWRTPRSENFPHFAQTRHYKVIRFALRVALALVAASAAANVLGFVSLSRVLGDGVLISAYVAIMLDACVRVAAALLAVALHVRPLSELRVVQRHGAEVRRRLTALLGWAAGAWWAVITLDAFSIRRLVFDRVEHILTARWGVGAVDLSLGGLLAFAACAVGSFLLSRLVRFILAEDVYPRVRLARGVPYAVSTLLHYCILFLGFLVAVASLGYDMTKFTILAGAFGVGLGFGMQNVVNNFVSGLILLFERPIQVGDVVELDPVTVGVVARIGIRASVVRTGSSAEVIVPNALLISGRVTNWTLSNRQRGFEVPVSVAGGAEPRAVIDLLTRVAREAKCVAKTPAPQVYVTEFLPGGGLKFEIRAWTDRFDDWVEARSELVAAVHRALADAGIQRL